MSDDEPIFTVLRLKDGIPGWECNGYESEQDCINASGPNCSATVDPATCQPQ